VLVRHKGRIAALEEIFDLPTGRHLGDALVVVGIEDDLERVVGH